MRISVLLHSREMYIIETYVKLHLFYMLFIPRNYTSSPENQFDLEMAYTVFSLLLLVGNFYEQFEKIKVASKRSSIYKENACSVTWFTPKICKMD